jgi:hypothetical protein
MSSSFKARVCHWGRRASVFLLLAVLAWAAAYHQNVTYVVDWSTVQSLDEESASAVAELDASELTIEVVAFSAQRRDEQAAVRDTAVRQHLEQIGRMSRRLTTRFVDFDAERGVARELEVRDYGSVVVKGLGKRIDLRESELFRVEGSGVDERQVFIGEPVIARAIAEILSGAKRQIVLWSGDSRGATVSAEPTGMLRWKQLMDSQGYVVTEVGEDGLSIGDGVAAVLVVHPPATLSDDDASALAAFVGRGGSLGYFVEPGGALSPLWSEIGIARGVGVAHDPHQAAPGGDRPLLVYGEHPITELFRSDHALTILQRPSPLVIEERAQLSTVALLETSSRGWAERSPEDHPRRLDPSVDGEGASPVAIASVWRGPEARRPSRVVLVGDSDFLTNAGFDEGEGNAAFALNTVRWLVGDDDRIGAIPAMAFQRTVSLAGRYGWLWIALPVFWVSVFAVALGLARRRRRTPPDALPSRAQGDDR